MFRFFFQRDETEEDNQFDYDESGTRHEEFLLAEILSVKLDQFLEDDPKNDTSNALTARDAFRTLHKREIVNRLKVLFREDSTINEIIVEKLRSDNFPQLNPEERRQFYRYLVLKFAYLT